MKTAHPEARAEAEDTVLSAGKADALPGRGGAACASLEGAARSLGAGTPTAETAPPGTRRPDQPASENPLRTVLKA